MGANVQRNLPPMALTRVGGTLPTPANSLNAEPITLASVVLQAGGRLGLQDKELASVFDLSAPDFSAAFSPNRPDRNRLMKQPVPDFLAREIAKVMGEQTGLSINGPDVARHALADVADAMARYLRVAVGGCVVMLRGWL
jgi:hypothetical protein